MNPNLNPKRVIRNVCRLQRVKQKDLVSKRRTAELAWTRQVAMFMLGRICDLYDWEVAEFFPLHSRSAVLYARQCVREASSVYPEIKQGLEMMEAVLRHVPSQTSPTSREP